MRDHVADLLGEARAAETPESTFSKALVRRFDESIMSTFRQAVAVTLGNPRLAFFALRALRGQLSARAKRARRRAHGLHVPPFMILSVTSRCNLQCAGCYARAGAARSDTLREMDFAAVRSVVAQARELGIGIILIAGGEPLLRPQLLELGRLFPGVVFLLFTNGVLLDDPCARRLRGMPNVVPVISIEGGAHPTDARRGAGVFHAALRAMRRLRKAGVFFGTSITLTTANYRAVTEPAFARTIRRAGCRHFVFVEYVPVEPGTDELALDERARAETAGRIELLRRTVRALFTAFPGGEEQFGGCLAAGRGFIHVAPTGAIEPCPFAPCSDSTLATMTLEQGLRSPLLRAIRDAEGSLRDTQGGCALWAQRERLAAIVSASDRLY